MCSRKLSNENNDKEERCENGVCEIENIKFCDSELMETLTEKPQVQNGIFEIFESLDQSPNLNFFDDTTPSQNEGGLELMIK